MKELCYMLLHKKVYHTAFTLSEVLITLGIIGIVAALTIPTLINNFRKIVIVNQLKQTYTLLKNAEQFAIKEYGNVEDWDFSSNNVEFPYGDSFAKKYYAPFLKTAPCKYETEASYRMTTYDGNFGFHSVWTWSDNIFCLPNNSMIFSSNIGSNGRISGKVIYVDINGTKEPNIFGKDIFSFMVGNTNIKKIDGYYDMGCPAKLSTCSPQGFIVYTHKDWDSDRDELVDACKSKGGNSGMNSCAYLIESAGWEIPKDYPVKL